MKLHQHQQNTCGNVSGNSKNSHNWVAFFKFAADLTLMIPSKNWQALK